MDTNVRNTSVQVWMIQQWNNEFTLATQQWFSRISGSRNHDHGIVSGSFWDHLGMIFGQSVGPFLICVWLSRNMFGTCLSTLLDHFWEIVLKELRSRNRMKLCQITFRFKVKHLMRSRGRSRDVCFHLIC